MYVKPAYYLIISYPPIANFRILSIPIGAGRRICRHFNCIIMPHLSNSFALTTNKPILVPLHTFFLHVQTIYIQIRLYEREI